MQDITHKITPSILALTSKNTKIVILHIKYHKIALNSTSTTKLIPVKINHFWNYWSGINSMDYMV